MSYCLYFGDNYSIDLNLIVENAILYDWNIEHSNFGDFFYLKNNEDKYICIDRTNTLYLGNNNKLSFYFFDEHTILAMLLSTNYHLLVDMHRTLRIINALNESHSKSIVKIIAKDVDLEIEDMVF